MLEWRGLTFSLTEKFMDKYRGKKPKFGPVGELVYVRTYSRELPNGKQEQFWQTIQRVVEGIFLIQKEHCHDLRLHWNERKAQKSAQEMYERMWAFKFLPPGRGLWCMGTDFVFNRSAAALFNCAFVSTKNMDDDFSLPFSWAMDMSMLGVGVGYDAEGAKKNLYLKTPRTTKEPHVVEDSREGWVNLLRRVLDAHVGKDTIPQSIDYSLIRPAGTPIKGFGGIAPGPGPLIMMTEKLQKVLSQYLIADKPVDSTLIVDTMNLAGEAVVAGGLRRTAQIALGEFCDAEFRNLKSKENRENSDLARWASNNSLVARKGDLYDNIVNKIASDGEPGIFWLANAQNYGRMKDPKNGDDYRALGINPCGEITLESFEACNICESFPANHDSLEDYLVTLKYAFMYCKTVTLLPTHSPQTNQVQMRNRRIGVSQTGIVDNINKIGFREHITWCDEGYKEIKRWDKIYSEWLATPLSRKVTCVKPSGSVSLVTGSSPGIHFPHSEYYLRRMRISRNSNLWKAMQEAGYNVEPDVKQPEYTMVIDIPVHEKYFSRRKSDVSMWEQLELAAQMQAYWADNQVSATVTFKPEEVKDISLALSMYETRLKSVSMLPLASEGYEQMPYEEITKEKYEELTSGLKKPKLIVDEEGKVIEKFCDGDVCEI